MADPVDIANNLIDLELQLAVNKICNHQTTSADNEFCTQCGDTIPEARRELGYALCVSCASHTERKRKFFAEA